MNKFKEIYDYKTMIATLVSRNLRGRYKGSVLGFAWTFLNPLLQLAVYTAVFSVIMRNGIEDYYLFLFVALIPWIFFSSSLTGGAYWGPYAQAIIGTLLVVLAVVLVIEGIKELSNDKKAA